MPGTSGSVWYTHSHGVIQMDLKLPSGERYVASREEYRAAMAASEWRKDDSFNLLMFLLLTAFVVFRLARAADRI